MKHMAVGEALVGGKKFQVDINLESPTPIQTANISSIMVLWEAASPVFYKIWTATAYLGRACGMCPGQHCPTFCTKRQLQIPRPSLTDSHLIISQVRRFHTKRQPVALQKTSSSLTFFFSRLKKASLLNPSFKALFPNYSVFLFLDFLS